MNAAEIIMETVDYYGQDPVGRRGIKRGTRRERQSDGTYETLPTSSCEYAVPNGETKHCAVGRCLSDEAKIWVLGIRGDVGDLIENWWSTNNSGDFAYDMEEDQEVYLDEMLAEEYQGQPKNFWDALQGLHDTHSNWSGLSGTCLTATGHKAVHVMAREFLSLDDKRQTAFMNEIASRSEQ